MYPSRREDSWYINLNSNRSSPRSSNNLNHDLSLMRVLIACEHSGVVRNAFQEKINNKEDTVVSCDLLPSSNPSGTHLQCDIRTILV